MKKTLRTVFYTIIAVILGIAILFFVISAIAVGSTGEKFGTAFFIILAIIFSISFYGWINIIRGKENNTQNIFKPKKQLNLKSNKSLPSRPDTKTNSKHKFKGESLREKVSDYTVIDLETTGTNVLQCEIIELSAVRIRNGEIIDTFSQLVKPSQKLPEVITNITGITDEMLENAPAISEVIEDYIKFIGNDIVVGHNIAGFDVNIIYDIYLKYCNKYFKNNMIDTYYYAKCCDIEVSDYKLTSIAKYFGIEYDAHRALNDCIANFKCYELLKEKYTGSQKYSSKKKSSDKPEKISKKPHKIKSAAEPIEGYTLKRWYKNVEISSWEHIPKDIEIGNRIVLIQEPTNEADSKAVMLLFVPQRKKLGYLYRGELQDMANEYINRGDKIVACLSYLKFKPCKVVKINLAFFQKNK